MEKLHFSIAGDFITKFAREKLNYENDPASAIKLLISCLISEDTTPTDRLLQALKILNGDARIEGVYPGDDYRITEDPDAVVDENNAVFQVAARLYDRNKELEKQYQELINKFTNMAERFSFLANNISKSDQMFYNRRYEDEYDGWLFQDVLPDEDRTWTGETRSESMSLMESYMARLSLPREDLPTADYGWLEPDGTFHEVPWAEHHVFAREYCEDNFPALDLSDKDNIWFDRSDPERPRLLDANDIMIDKLGWILIHNPGQGLPHHQASDVRHMTKEQKEFLYDFYHCRNMISEANALYDDE